MNDPRKTRLLTGIIIALVALNIGLLGWFFLRSDARQHRSGQLHGQTFLADTLGFDARQRQQLAELQRAYFKEIRPQQRQLRQARKAYFHLTDSSLTETQRREKVMAFHRQSAEVELTTLAHFDKVAAICTPAQRQLLDGLLNKLPGRSLRMPGERGGNGPGHDRPGQSRSGKRNRN